MLINAVRSRVDLPNANQYIPDTTVTSYINDSAAELDDILVAKNEDYRLTVLPFTVSSGTRYPLPADFYQLRGVDFYTNNGSTPWVTLQAFSLPDRNKYNQPFYAYIPGLVAPYYKLEDGYIAFIPQQAAIGNYQLYYTPVLPQLVNTTDTIPSYLDNQAWREYVVLDVAIKIQVQQEKPCTEFMAQKAAMHQRVQALAGKRNAGAPKCGRFTRQIGGRRFMGVGGGYGGYGGY
jgi:hypothetical protein